MVKYKNNIILVSDDDLDEWFQRTAKAVPAASILTAKSAYEAEQQIHQHKPALLVLDVVLPESEFNSHRVLMKRLGEQSFKVAQTFRKECPEGKIIVVSMLGQQLADQYPPGTKFINSCSIEEYNKFEETIVHNLGLSEQPDSSFATSPSLAEKIERPTLHRSRIKNIREGAFYDDPERHR